MDSARLRARRMLLDPDTPLSAALRECVLAADQGGDAALAAWARQEIDGYPPTGPVPAHRRITAPIYGEAMRTGSPVWEPVGVDELVATHRSPGRTRLSRCARASPRSSAPSPTAANGPARPPCCARRCRTPTS